MRVEIISAIDTGRQTLAAGVIAELPDDEAERLVAAGIARKVGAGETANPVLDGMVDVPPEKPKRKG